MILRSSRIRDCPALALSLRPRRGPALSTQKQDACDSDARVVYSILCQQQNKLIVTLQACDSEDCRCWCWPHGRPRLATRLFKHSNLSSTRSTCHRVQEQSNPTAVCHDALKRFADGCGRRTSEYRHSVAGSRPRRWPSQINRKDAL